MSIDKLLKTFKSPPNKEGILDELDRYLITYNKPNDLRCPYDERDADVHHPSELSAVDCIRRIVYGWLKVEKTDNQNDPKGRRIFDTGHDFGYRMQGYFWDMGILLGKWHCVVCGHTWVDMENPSPRKCPSCQKDLILWYNLHYLEVPIFYKEKAIGGKSDALLLRPWGRQLVELKTIKNRDVATGARSFCFEDLNSPKPEHSDQLQIYLDCANRLYGNITNGLIIYTGKNNQMLKQFPIKLLPEMVAPMYVKLDIVDQCLKDRILPKRIGESQSDPRCRFCPYLSICWEGFSFEQLDKRGLKNGTNG